jgi:hypothetical protein
MSKRSTVTPADVASWLRNETPEHLTLMTRLREKLAKNIDTDVTNEGTPSRDWCRSLARYQQSYTTLLTEERERFKLRLAMSKQGEGLLDDQEYEQGLKELALESIATLPADALHRELERRGLEAPVFVEREDDE